MSSVSAWDWTEVSPWRTPVAGGGRGEWGPWGRPWGWGWPRCPGPGAGSGKFLAVWQPQLHVVLWWRSRSEFPGPWAHRSPGPSHTDWPAGRRARPTCGVPGVRRGAGREATPRDAPGPPGYSPGHLQSVSQTTRHIRRLSPMVARCRGLSSVENHQNICCCEDCSSVPGCPWQSLIFVYSSTDHHNNTGELDLFTITLTSLFTFPSFLASLKTAFTWFYG